MEILVIHGVPTRGNGNEYTFENGWAMDLNGLSSV